MHNPTQPTRIAIVGTACRYPDANSPEALWENVLAQRRAFRRIPEERLSLADYFSADRSVPDAIYATQAAVIADYEFDRNRFRVAGRTFRAVDMTHWLALEVAADALANAGFANAEDLPRAETGVYLGNSLTGEFSRANLMRLRWPYVRRVLDSALAQRNWPTEDRTAFLSGFEQTYKNPFPAVNDETLAGGLSNTIAGRICNYFDLKGGGYTVDGACASSLLAVATACSALVAGDVEVALAGGVDLSLDPFELIGFSKVGALAAEEMRVYDLHSAGFWPGEGCGMVVLMRLDDAMRLNRPVLATLRGWGISSDGSGGLTRPEVEGQVLAMTRAYRRAGFGIDTVGYFEGHGTGTGVGDPTEIKALSQARRQAGGTGLPAALGSIKANIGHTKAAAGVAGLLKATLAIHRQLLPPSTGWSEPHPAIAEEGHQLRLLSQGEPWPVDLPLRAAVSAMGFGGINTHIVLEGPEEGAATLRRRTLRPRDRQLLGSAQDAELILLAADNVEELDHKLQALEPIAQRISRSDLTDLACHLAEHALVVPPLGGMPSNGEMPAGHHAPMAGGIPPKGGTTSAGEVRAALVVSRPQELAGGLKRLRDWLAEGTTDRIDVDAGLMLGCRTTPPAIGYLFSGQGTSFRRDGGLWGRRFDSVQELYTFADLPRDGSDAATEIAQPAIITALLAGLDILGKCGIEASVGIGHSLGELAAYHWAGAIDKPALLRLANARGRAIAEHGRPGGAMASIGAGEETVAPAIASAMNGTIASAMDETIVAAMDETVISAMDKTIAGRALVLAGLNTPLQTVISGGEAAVDAFVDLMKGAGIAATRLHVSQAFHSPFMDLAAAALQEALQRERFQNLAAAVVSTVTGSRLTADADLRQILVQQMTQPVRFAQAVRQVAKDVDLWIEVGPGHVLTGMMSRLDDSPAIALDSGGTSVKGLLKAIAAAFALGAPVSAEALFQGRFHRPFDPAHEPRFLANPCEQAPLEQGAGSREQGERPDLAFLPAPRSLLPAPCSALPAIDTPLDVVRRMAAQRAELPMETVGKNLRLLGDLHLSSIAVAQLVTESARALGLEPPIWPTEAANATIAEVAEALEQLAGNAATAPSVRTESLDGIAAWTRPFTVELAECPRVSGIPARRDVPPANGTRSVPDTHTWKIIAAENDPLLASLPPLLDRDAPGGGVAVCLPPCSLPRTLWVAPCSMLIDLLLDSARELFKNAGRKRFLLVQHGGGAAGFARTLHLERPEMTVCVVDVPDGHAASADWIAAEASAAHGYVEAHYDNEGIRREPRLRLLEEPKSSGPLPLGPEDVLLVTGGGKGIGAECAMALAKASGARLALLGRTRPENKGDRWEEWQAELAANLNRFAGLGVTFRYYTVDITDAEAVRQTVQEVERDLGSVTGVLHSAGVNQPQRLETLDAAAFLRTVRPKVQGLRNILDSVAPDRLRLLIAFGSIIARTGMPGEADYAVANEWMTRLVEGWQSNHAHCRCLSVEWSVWSGVGMGERLGSIDALRGQGISAITPDAGVAALMQLVARPTSPVAVVVTGRFGEPATLKFDPPNLPLLRFLERIRLRIPGVELIAEADLSLDTDPYLSDHVYQGAALFPAVMGLEAMAQAAEALAQSAEAPAFEDVALTRPVVVPREGPLTIRLVALRTGPNCVQVALRSQETNFQADHFRATCIFGPEARADDFTESVADRDALRHAALPLDPDSDLYGGILFQRGRLQRVRGYRHLRATECVAEIQSDSNIDWFSQYLPGELVLGDAGARDATLHGIQACIPHGVLLPTGVDRLTIHVRQAFQHDSSQPDPSQPGKANVRTIFAHARERSREGDDFVYDVDVTDASGRLLERWHGLQLRLIRAAVPKGPWAAPLLATYLQRKVHELIRGSAVSIALEDCIALEGRAALDRHSAGDGAIQQALGADVAIHRRGDGKPEACVLESVSASHSGSLTLAICGEREVACDLERVTQRAAGTWQDILGPRRQALAVLISREASEDQAAASTRVWSAAECLKKAGLGFDAPLVLASVQADGWVMLESGPFHLATCVVAVRGQEGKLSAALLVENQHAGL
jgi:enediyne polyketide synthase